MPDETPELKIDRIDSNVREIMIVLKGYNGYPGLCKRHEILATDYYKFKRWILTIVGLFVGSGALGAGIYKIFLG